MKNIGARLHASLVFSHCPTRHPDVNRLAATPSGFKVQRFGAGADQTAGDGVVVNERGRPSPEIMLEINDTTKFEPLAGG